jgi:hypothetical protein
MPLVGGAVFASGVGDAGDTPLPFGANKVEEVGAAMIDLAIQKEVKGRPDDGEIVVDADNGIVDSFGNRDLCSSGAG